MPKAKTHSGGKKRFRVTKTGKVLHKRTNRNHLLEKKSGTRKRRLAQAGELSGGDRRQARRLLGGR